MDTIIAIGVILIIIILASYKIYSEKKAGAKCIGCPHSKECSNDCHH